MKSQEFLARKKVSTTTTVDAKKSKLQFKDGLELLKGMNELYAMRGKKVVHLDLKKDKPDEATLKGLLMGPTGNLRAPTFKVGKTVMIGFEEETYKKVLG